MDYKEKILSIHSFVWLNLAGLNFYKKNAKFSIKIKKKQFVKKLLFVFWNIF